MAGSLRPLGHSVPVLYWPDRVAKETGGPSLFSLAWQLPAQVPVPVTPRSFLASDYATAVQRASGLIVESFPPGGCLSGRCVDSPWRVKSEKPGRPLSCHRLCWPLWQRIPADLLRGRRRWLCRRPWRWIMTQVRRWCHRSGAVSGSRTVDYGDLGAFRGSGAWIRQKYPLA